ncbi:carbohydrate sulfotransferase 1-like [Glandiceps talaboti]
MKTVVFWFVIILVIVVNIMIYHGYLIVYMATRQTIPGDVIDTAKRKTDETVFEAPKKQDDVLNTKNGLRILIIGAFRSGSTFTGQLLNQNPSIFYFFEPLRLVQDIVHGNMISDDLQNSTKFELIDNLFNCRFPSYYVHHMRNWDFATHESKALRRVCRQNGGCSRTSTRDFSDSCKLHNHIAMKVIRLDSVELLKPLIADEGLNLKILHLVRDPRGVANSRKSLYRSWENRSLDKLGLTDGLRHYCEQTADMISFSAKLPGWMKGRYKIMRYEDAAMEPLQTAKNIYKYLGLPFPKPVRLWINKNTKEENLLDFSNMKTKKNSSATAQAWRTRLAFRDVQTLQPICAKLMHLLRYENLQNEADMRNLSVKTF